MDTASFTVTLSGGALALASAADTVNLVWAASVSGSLLCWFVESGAVMRTIAGTCFGLIFFHLIQTRLRRPQPKQWCPDFSHPRHFLQHFLGYSGALQGQAIVSSACPGSTLGPHPDGTPISKREPNHPAEDTHFCHLFPRTRPFSHYPKFMIIGEITIRLLPQQKNSSTETSLCIFESGRNTKHLPMYFDGVVKPVEGVSFKTWFLLNISNRAKRSCYWELELPAQINPGFPIWSW